MRFERAKATLAGKTMVFVLFSATMLGLHGCMSSATDQLESVQLNARPTEKTTSEDTAKTEQLSKIEQLANADATLLNGSTLPDEKVQPDPVDPAAAQKNIAATKASIFSTGQPVAAEHTLDQQRLALEKAAAANNGEPLDATKSSIFAGATEPLTTATNPVLVPDASDAAKIQELALAGLDTSPNDAKALVPSDTLADPELAYAASKLTKENRTDPAEAVVKPVEARQTLTDLLLGKKPEKAFDTDRFGKDRKKKTSTDEIPNMQTAALGDETLAGLDLNAMFPVAPDMSEDEIGEGGEDPNNPLQLASLPGLARLAPNGLWTQTEKVEVRCLRPQLINVIKYVEDHYKRPVIVTSGFRDVRHNRRAGGVRHSLHTLCAAADIQVQGVSKWELADYLRSLPGRGGVGTYCHTDSVHIDIGGERDWNWRCRRKKRRS